MFFKRKKSDKEVEVGQAGNLSDWTVAEDHKVTHDDYLIVPSVKQLTNGKWVVRLAFETQREDGAQRYDYPGPMREYEDQAAACQGGLQFAVKRIKALSEIKPAPADFE